MSWRRLGRQKYVTLKTSFRRLHQDERLLDVLARRLQDVFKKTSCNYVLKTSWKTKIRYTEDVFKTSARHLQYVFTKTNVCWDDNWQWRLKMKKRSHRYDINRSRPRPRHSCARYNVVSVYWWLHVLSNDYTTSEAQFMKTLSKTEAELKKRCLQKKACIVIMYTVKRKIFVFMIKCCMWFSPLIAANSKFLSVYCLFACMVGLFFSALFVLYYDNFNGEFVFYFSWLWTADHVKNIVRTCPFDIYFG